MTESCHENLWQFPYCHNRVRRNKEGNNKSLPISFVYCIKFIFLVKIASVILKHCTESLQSTCNSFNMSFEWYKWNQYEHVGIPYITNNSMVLYNPYNKSFEWNMHDPYQHYYSIQSPDCKTWCISSGNRFHQSAYWENLSDIINAILHNVQQLQITRDSCMSHGNI